MVLLNSVYFNIIKKLKSISNGKTKTHNFQCFVFLLLFCASIYFVCKFLTRNYNPKAPNGKISLELHNIPKYILEYDDDLVEITNENCSYWDCFNVYRCGQKQHNEGRISIYVYPLHNYVDAKGQKAFTLTKEFYTILKTIVNSPYYTSNPNEACILVPTIDTLNLMNVQMDLVSKALASLPTWENGQNHLLFNMVGSDQAFNTANALIASAYFDTWTYRTSFDISLPFYSPNLYDFKASIEPPPRPYDLIISTLTLQSREFNTLIEIAINNPKILLLQHCATNQRKSEETTASENDNMLCSYPAKDAFSYPSVLERGVFCLVTLDGRYNHFTLLEALAANCIPLVIDDTRVMPFNEIIDWTLASIKINARNLGAIMDKINHITPEKINELRKQIHWLYHKYFNSLETIVLTMLDNLNDRVQPHEAKTYLDWNIPKSTKATHNPLFLPLIAPKSQGFTAIILTYDRIESLMTLVQKLSVVPSLQKILIVWNNQKKSPPHLGMFQKISKPMKIIQTKENKLSNRFYPYEEIETEAILTIDDDIIMLTADELDFGYEVWREFPDRIVGFPSRTHVWDNVTSKWTYESEWTNQISMVLTGAAFHHKFWSYMYTNSMPGNIKEWVDQKMNCEDIAMNFLVANITNKPPIKVAPRKKFKCPECTNAEMLSADLNHMMERSACIDRFAQIYGTMPLKTIEFRADPVLYKDNFPEKLKRFNDIGSL